MTDQTPADDLDLTYAIGDIHGRADLLKPMLAMIEEVAAGRPHKIITLGDYIDRGPDSKEVLDILMARPDIIPLIGNHELLLLAATHGDEDDLGNFLRNGGGATLRSFGVDHPAAIPPEYLTWIRERTHYYHETPRRVFVHAGVAWSQPDMLRQPRDLLVWIREGFLDHPDPFFKYIVHGHTHTHAGKPETDKVEVLGNRCNLDTCAYATGVLACASFDNTQNFPLETGSVTKYNNEYGGS